MSNLNYEVNENILAKGKFRPNMAPESKEPESNAERKKYLSKMKDRIKISKKEALISGFVVDA